LLSPNNDKTDFEIWKLTIGRRQRRRMSGHENGTASCNLLAAATCAPVRTGDRWFLDSESVYGEENSRVTARKLLSRCGHFPGLPGPLFACVPVRFTAQRCFMASASLFRPSGVMPPCGLGGLLASLAG
jgi:hypothetical protein